MKILSGKQVKALESEYMVREGITSLELMERAGVCFVNWFIKKFSSSTPVIIFCGSGNNGGDGMVIGRLLLQLSYQVRVYSLKSEKYSEENLINRTLLEKMLTITYLNSAADFPEISEKVIIIDALFGIGLSRRLDGFMASLIQMINTSAACVVSVDIASGLFPDQKSEGPIIEPQWTATFQTPKLSFMLPGCSRNVGKMEILDLGITKDILDQQPASCCYLVASMIKPLIKNRDKYAHKGSFGRALIIAGNYGMMGAAVLSVKACYCSGAGLLRCYIPYCGYPIMQISVPEAMTLTDPSFFSITDIPDIEPYNAIAIGPGIAEDVPATNALRKLLTSARIPLVVDAGALNILGKNRELLKLLPANSILTPHPKEFERLTDKQDNDFDRLESLKQFASQISCIVVLKGAHTAIALPDGKVYFNSTGNAGMATGGSGDVLTGIITGLIAQAYTPAEAAIMGVYMHGYAGDVAAERKSQPAMLAGDIVNCISDFYKDMMI